MYENKTSAHTLLPILKSQFLKTAITAKALVAATDLVLKNLPYRNAFIAWNGSLLHCSGRHFKADSGTSSLPP